MIYRCLVVIFILSISPQVWAQLDGEECEPNSIVTACIGDDEGPTFPPPLPTSSDLPPATVPPEELFSLSETYIEIDKLVDWYLLQVFSDLGHPNVSISSIESQLLTTANSEASTQSTYNSIDTADQRILYMKMRVLKANHPEFATSGQLPPTLVALVEHALELEAYENDLILVTQ